MATFRDLVPTLDFKLEPSHTVLFNPAAELKELETSGRKYPAVLVTTSDKKRFMLPLGSNRLATKLHAYDDRTAPVLLKITRITAESGNAFDTDYTVEEIKDGKAQVKS